MILNLSLILIVTYVRPKYHECEITLSQIDFGDLQVKRTVYIIMSKIRTYQ